MFAKPSPSLSLTLTSLTLNFSKTRVAFYGGEGCPPRSSSSSLHCPPPPYIFLPATWKSDLKPSNLSGEALESVSGDVVWWRLNERFLGWRWGVFEFLVFAVVFPSLPFVECFLSRCGVLFF